MSSRRRVWLLASLLFTTSLSANAATSAAPPTRVDPAAHTAFTWLQRDRILPPWFDESVRKPVDGRLPLTVRTRDGRPPRASHHVSLGRAGQALASGAYSVRVDAAGLRELERDPRVGHLELTLRRRGPRPLDGAQKETGVAAAFRRLLARDGKQLDGRGVLIADVDSPLFSHHPAFFRADAGAHAWLDVNGDGAFTLGVDGVDQDGDGVIADGEQLRLLSAEASSLYGDSIVPASTSLRPGLDYLYLDANGNGRRDFGGAFDESTPGYGEPLFLVDDANGNGRLDREERLLQLGSSKIRKLHAGRIYTRGASTNPLSKWNGLANPDESMHATGVTGILVGGEWGVSQWLGLAPGAEVINYAYGADANTDTTEGVQWALDEGAHVLVTEYAPYTGYPLDGSSEEERLIDAAVARGMLVVSPAGNLGGSEKHARFDATGAELSLTVSTDEYFAGSPVIMMTLLDRGPAPSLVLTVTPPGGGPSLEVDAAALAAAPSSAPLDLGGGLQLYVEVQRTSRGTNMINLYWVRATQQALPAGPYPVTVRTTRAEPLQVDAFVADYTTSWAYGATFTENTTDVGTVCHPATAEQTVSVAAYTLHEDRSYGGWGPAGELAEYSAQGPLLDGRPGISLAAPDNPLAAGVPSKADQAGHSVTFTAFGGTSGAGPHVAAVAALLRQAYPEESATALRQRLLDGTRPVAGGAPSRWGAGKLDAVQALGLEQSEGSPPRAVRVELPEDGVVRQRSNVLRVRAEGLGSATRSRWDLDYDGQPDTDWIEGDSVTFTPEAIGRRALRVWVVDDAGYVAGTAFELEVTATPVGSGDALGLGGGSGCGVGAAGDAHPAGFWLGALSLGAVVAGRRRRAR